jgi:hypothetical protein
MQENKIQVGNTEQVLLSKKNCHRALKVVNIANPEQGEWLFNWRGKKLSDNLMRCDYTHTAVRISDNEAVVINGKDLGLWSVVEWKYEVNLEEFWKCACGAFYATSFSPEERGSYHIRMYEEELNDDIKTMPEEERERYIAKYKEWVQILFNKHSRIMSAMITGPARFPSRRNEKMNNYYDNAVNEFRAWREKVLKAIARRIEEAKPEEQKNTEEWLSVKSEIDNIASTLKDIDTGVNTYSYRPLFVSSLYGKLERIANNGKVDVIVKSTEYIKELNEKLPKPIFTNRHKFWKLVELANQSIVKQAERENQEDAEIFFDGGRVIKNYSEDRLQIVFDTKPQPDVISNLKHNGFRWSPRFSAWQRQLTNNAYYAVSRVIPITIEQLMKGENK